MARRSKLTNNSEEAEISSLLSGDSIFSIPYFQRPYKWKSARLRQFEEDVLGLVDDDSLNHFLGAVIIHGRRSSPSDPTIYEVIDGQQRITTLFLYLAAGIKTLADAGYADDASALFQKYMAIGRNVKEGSNFKLHSCKDDRRQLNRVIDDLLKNAKLAVAIGTFAPKKLSDTGPASGTVVSNYEAAKRFFKHQADTFGMEQVLTILGAMLERISVVQIDVLDPTNGPKIFDGLNSRQEPMTIGDLVRNEIFSRVASLSPEEIEYIDAHNWQPFYGKFRVSDSKSLFDSYFFPYGLIKNPNLSKSEVYGYLRREWEKIPDPPSIIEQLASYQNAFLDLMNGSNLQKLDAGPAKAVRHFFEFDFPASTLPFLMQLTQGMATGTVDLEVGRRILEVTESFLVRRAICGIEPTGLHSVFRRLWVDVGADLSPANVANKIRERVTVTWPSDDFLRKSVRERALYGTSIAPYVIRQYDEALGGDVPANIPWVEHVLPQTPVEAWSEKFSKEEMKSMTNLWANLIPLSSKMNIELKNAIYSAKRPSYKADAMFKSARQFAERFDDWTPDSLTMRSNELADWAVQRWPT